jgi:HD-GYP domain-containing protein (c-di-GMP phosphodiesterase class II)
MTASTALLLENVQALRRRERLRERGASLLLQIFRLIKVAQFHALDNMAVVQALGQTTDAIRVFCSQTNEPVSLLFMRGTIFVGGQLLKATRTEYDSALELAALIEGMGFHELRIDADAGPSDLEALLNVVRTKKNQRSEQRVLLPSPKVRLRRVSAATLARDDEQLPPEEQVFRTYASIVVVMRGIFENAGRGRFELPHQAKRLAQRLVTLSEGDTPAFLGVTAMRNATHDAAGRAVNTSILAVAMGRQLTQDLALLARIAMSALLHDVGRPILAGELGDVQALRGVSDEDEQRLPAATALALTALGHLRQASIVRTVVDYEAQWHRQRAQLGPPYAGARAPTVMARLVATAQRFNEILTVDPAADRAPTPDEAVTLMKTEAQDDVDRAMIDLLVGAVGIFPSGTPVELNTGERGVVIRTPDHPAQYVRPTVQLVYDAQGKAYGRAVIVDLVSDATREVTRVVRDADERLATASDVAFARARSSLPPSRGNGGASSAPARAASAAPPRATSAPPSRAPVAPSRRPPENPPSIAPLPHSSAPPRAAPDERTAVALKVSDLLTRSQIAEHGTTPAAVGALSKTPFPHLMVHTLDRALTGTVVLIEDQGEFIDEHAVLVRQGRPAKVYTSNLVTPLSSMLVAAGLVEKEQLEDGSLRKVAGDEAQLEHELCARASVSTAELEKIRSEQVLQRLSSLFKLPRDSTYYAFFADSDLVQPLWGKLEGSVATRAALARGIREHPDDVTMDLVLARANDYVPKLRPQADLDGFAFRPEELDVVMRISREPMLTQRLLASSSDVDVTRRVLYTLLLTRSLALVEP